MSLREQFEKLFPVPRGVEWTSRNDCYWPKPHDSTQKFNDLKTRTIFVEAAHYTAAWQGFQAGHAAGLEAAAKVAEETIEYETEFMLIEGTQSAAAIRRSIKGE